MTKALNTYCKGYTAYSGLCVSLQKILTPPVKVKSKSVSMPTVLSNSGLINWMFATF